jgi:protein O-GlcNAc transferase
MAQKPAPIQLTWLFSASSTGMETIDYRISDPHIDAEIDPGNSNDSCYSERTFRLPETAWCYDPLFRSVPVNPLPAVQIGHVTFGSLNRLSKTNDAVLSVWSEVLKAVDGSRLCLLAPQGSARQRLRDRFASLQVAPERILFVPRQSGADYLKAYHQIDIVLDTFPYNGHNTSRDALWMGVPVITLAHRRPVGRVGVSLLSNVGLTHLIAPTPAAFVSIAKRLADDLPALAALRAGLRERFEASPLMNAPQFARNMETAYRKMWHDWCEATRPSSNQSERRPLQRMNPE